MKNDLRFATQGHQFRSAGTLEVLTVNQHFTRRRRIQTQQGAAGRGFAAAAFAHQTEGFTALNFKGEAIHGTHQANLTLQDQPAHDRKMFGQVFDLHQRGFGIAHRAAPVVTSTQQAIS